MVEVGEERCDIRETRMKSLAFHGILLEIKFFFFSLSLFTHLSLSHESEINHSLPHLTISFMSLSDHEILIRKRLGRRIQQ